MLTKSADVVWSRLNGIICVYKPVDVSIDYLKHKIKKKICEGLNSLETRPPVKYIDVDYRTDGSISVDVRTCYADTFLSVGERYQPQFVEVICAAPLGHRTSGVTVFGINGGCHDALKLKKAFLTKCIHVKGVFGFTTNDYHFKSRVIGRAKYHRVNKYLVDKILASYQASHQLQIFKNASAHLTLNIYFVYGPDNGSLHKVVVTSQQQYSQEIYQPLGNRFMSIDFAAVGFSVRSGTCYREKDLNPKSQEAYELAAKGFYRPENKGNPLIYNIKCVELHPPDFKLEVHCINETEEYLMRLIHNLGISLKTLGCCAGLRCLRQGPFHIDHSLLIRQLTLQNIIDNMELCSDVLKKHFPRNIEYEPMVRIKDSLEEGDNSDERNKKLIEG